MGLESAEYLSPHASPASSSRARSSHHSGSVSAVAAATVQHENHEALAVALQGLKVRDAEVHDRIDCRSTNLNHFHGEAQFEKEISHGQFTKVKGLSDCCGSDGKVELHRWSRLSESHPADPHDCLVVVKRVSMARVWACVDKERNEREVHHAQRERSTEDVLNEIGIYCFLGRRRDLPTYILRMHTVFQSTTDAWLVLEHANGGDLFDVVQKRQWDGGSLTMRQIMTWMWQLLQAVHYLHQNRIGHRDISLENVLLCHGQVRLMDFGQAVQTHSSGAIPLRYFSALGKPPYRPPECYVPLPRTVEVLVPSDARMGEVTFAKTASGGHLCDVRFPPSATPGQTCTAEPSGYLVPPVDVFACGVCLFMMITGMPPWKLAILSDSHFQFVKANGILKLLHAWKKLTPLVADELLALMLRFDPAKRPSAEQCLSHLWFKPLSGSEVPLHRSSPPASPTPSPCRSDSQTSFCSASSESPPEPTVAQVEKLGSSACASPQRGKTAVDDATLRMSCGDFYSDPEPPVHRGFESFLQASPPTCAPPTHRRHGRSCPRVRRSALGSTLKMSAACAETSAGEAPERVSACTAKPAAGSALRAIRLRSKSASSRPHPNRR